MKIFTVAFWRDYALERAIKTFSQTAIAALGAGSVGLFSIDYASLFSLAGGAALLSVLTSIVAKSKA
tara:strand:+ start:320 stop:520 length:201 start_codon:yes stop_codon:yes gene_type:complete